ncbi:hypothetical protein ABPG75_005592 [Micractinium tetrahymenae]
MAPRRSRQRSSAATAPSAGAAAAAEAAAAGTPDPSPGFADLPDEIVQAILGQLALEDRLRSAALVCRQWRRACACPQLLREIRITEGALPRGRVWTRQRFEALFAWLAAGAAPHIRSLHAAFSPMRNEEDPSMPVCACMSLLARPTGASRGSGGSALRELSLAVSCDVFEVAYWPLGLTGLRRLALSNTQCGDVQQVRAGLLRLGSLAAMRSLERLHLAASVVDGHGLGTLPPSITHLTWSEAHTAHLPGELSDLTALESLSLEGCQEFDPTWHHTQQDVLALLPRLRHLRISKSTASDGLYALTRLQSLYLRPLNTLHRFELDAGVSSLAQLTALALVCAPLAPGAGAALGALPHLQRFVHCLGEELGSAPLVAGFPPLLGRLRWLGLDWQQLLSSPGLLEAAAHGLERLIVMGSCAGGTRRQWQAVCRWAADQTSLQSLELWPGYGPTFGSVTAPAPGREAQAALGALRRRRPGLRVEVHPAGSLRQLWRAMFPGIE